MKRNSSERNKKVNISDKNKKRIRLGISILISCMLVVIGILFITSCYSIYKSGHSPFTRESISNAFSRIAVWVYITISLVIVGAAVSIVLPDEEKKLKGERSPEVMVKRLADKVDVSSIDTGIASQIQKERSLRRVLGYVRCALLVISAIIPLFYLLNPANFPAVSGEYNAEISHGMLVYLAFLFPMIAYEVAYVIVRDLSYNRESELLKKAMASGGKAQEIPEQTTCLIVKAYSFVKENAKQITLGVRIALVGCAIVFIVIGSLNGGMADVLNKAIKICTECIGLG